MKSTFPAFILTVLLALSATPLWGSLPPRINDLPVSSQLYSISTGPGDNAATAMCISWACDTVIKHTCVLLAEAADKDWASVREIKPTQHHHVDVFKGV